jgi:hypothetical protein
MRSGDLVGVQGGLSRSSVRPSVRHSVPADAPDARTEPSNRSSTGCYWTSGRTVRTHRRTHGRDGERRLTGGS